jgi:photosystem II stability/assembly factor-like uncharacterized protein
MSAAIARRVKQLALTSLMVLALPLHRGDAQPLSCLPRELQRGFDKASFLDMTQGYVFAYGSGTVLATEDGGTTWRLVLDLPGGASNQSVGIYALFALDSQRLWVLTSRGGLYRSTDGGRTFNVSTPTYVGPLINPSIGRGRTMWGNWGT